VKNNSFLYRNVVSNKFQIRTPNLFPCCRMQTHTCSAEEREETCDVLRGGNAAACSIYKYLALVIGAAVNGCLKAGTDSNKSFTLAACVSLMSAFNGDALMPETPIAHALIVLKSNVVTRAHRSRIAYRCAMSVFIMAINSLPQRVKICLRCVIER
jgi:hypothetical protein